jgi:Ca2+-binding RTX toxin-like protein
MRTPLVLAGLALLTAGLPAPTAQAVADAVECQGQPATIVQSEGIVEGTDGDDVIVGGRDTKIRAGKGDDTICVTGGRVRGGQGRDSVEMRGTDNEDFVLLRDIEDVDVETGWGLDGVRLLWSRTPDVLTGTIDGGDSDDVVSARAGRVTVDLMRGRVTVGRDAFLSLTGFENAAAEGFRARVLGDDERNRLYLSGCRIAAEGRGGNDLIDVLQHAVGAACAGGRVRGQGGNDRLRGGKKADVLLGGAGRDRADGGPGVDRCVAEKEYGCER